MRCYVCGRPLLHAAATVKTADGIGYAGPTCARAKGLIPPAVRRPRLFTIRPRRKVDTGQIQIEGLSR